MIPAWVKYDEERVLKIEQGLSDRMVWSHAGPETVVPRSSAFRLWSGREFYSVIKGICIRRISIQHTLEACT